MRPRVFGVDYAFLSCGAVFTDGLAHAAADLGLPYAHACWDQPLANLIPAFQPDLVFVVHGRKFSQRFYSVKFGATPTAVWLLDEPYEVDDTAMFSPRFDQVFVNDPATLHRHPRATYLPVCYDPHVYTTSLEWRGASVGFIGGGNGTRDRYLSALAAHGLLTYVVGGEWTDPAVQRLCLSPNIPATATADHYRRTKIVLNVFRERHHFNARKTPATAMNPRIYEATACGALVVSEWRPELEAVVPELPTFRSEAECVDLIQYFLAHPDEADARQRQCAARLAPHTYAARLQTVLATVGLAVAA